MAYERKTVDVYEIWSDYGQGWEVECEGEDKADAKRLLKEYNENAPQWPHSRKSGEHHDRRFINIECYSA